MWSDIPGWFSFAPVYDEMVLRAKDGDTITEIGTAFGRSIAYLAQATLAAGKRLNLYAVDPWFDDWWMMPKDYPADAPRPSWGGEHAAWARKLGGPFSAFIHCMVAHAPKELEIVRVLRCTSAEAAKMIGPCRGVLIDGNHDYEHVAQDIALWRPHMVEGSILAGDDFADEFPGVKRAVGEAFGVGGYEVEGTTWVVR